MRLDTWGSERYIPVLIHTSLNGALPWVGTIFRYQITKKKKKKKKLLTKKCNSFAITAVSV